MTRRFGWGQANRIIARAREERLKREADPLATKLCRDARREGDEYVCPKCLMRWGSDEERPACGLK